MASDSFPRSTGGAASVGNAHGSGGSLEPLGGLASSRIVVVLALSLFVVALSPPAVAQGTWTPTGTTGVPAARDQYTDRYIGRPAA